MSRRTRRRNSRRRSADARPQPAAQQKSAASYANGMTMTAMRLALDSYSNSLARLGEGQDNLMNASEYPLIRRTQNYSLMNSLYRGDWLARRIIDLYAEDMCKNWYHISSQVEPEMLDEYTRLERKTRIKQKIITGVKWGRLYGGAAGLIMIDGQDDMLDEPVNFDLIMPGDFKGVNIVDRWCGVTPSSDLVEDLNDPDFGLPDFYDFSFGSGVGMTSKLRVHHSRVLRFTGRELPYLEQISENYWGASELEHVYDELTKRNMTSANIAQLIFQANLRILKMGDLGELMADTSPEVQRDLYNTIEAQNMLMSSFGLQLMNSGDEFQTYSYSFAGLSEVYEQFMLDVSGAAEIPATKLFGRSPAGMNATGESDLTNYYDSISQKQESSMRPVLDKLVPILAMSTWGAIPDDLEYEFYPVGTSSEEQRAKLVEWTTRAITGAYQADLISQQVALKELRNTEAATGMWGSITNEDIDRADDMTGFGPGEGTGFGRTLPESGQEQHGQQQHEDE